MAYKEAKKISWDYLSMISKIKKADYFMRLTRPNYLEALKFPKKVVVS